MSTFQKKSKSHIQQKYYHKHKKNTNIRFNDVTFVFDRYFCIWFIDFMFKGKMLLDYTNLCSPNQYKINYKIILKICQ